AGRTAGPAAGDPGGPGGYSGTAPGDPGTAQPGTAQPGGAQPGAARGDPDAAAIAAERLAVAGHNLHPCGRTRLGWDTTDVLEHDLEAGPTTIGFVAVRDDGHLGDDVGAA